MGETMTVRDIARQHVVTANREQTVGNIATVMREEHVGSVVIVEEGAPVGILTDRDLAMQVLEPRRDPASVTAGEVMTDDPVTVSTEDGVFEVTKTLFETQARRLPLVDTEGSVAGIVTLDDFLVLLTDELNGLAGVIEAESPPY